MRLELMLESLRRAQNETADMQARYDPDNPTEAVAAELVRCAGCLLLRAEILIRGEVLRQAEAEAPNGSEEPRQIS